MPGRQDRVGIVLLLTNGYQSLPDAAVVIPGLTLLILERDLCPDHR